MKNLAGLMKQASQMQQKMQEMQAALEQAEVEGQAGAGMVSIVLSGKGEMKRLRIDPKLADPAEMEMLQDLILAAHADARRKVDAMTAEQMQQATGGLQLPPGMKLPF
jgi:DNA-binding YbaB/EbfC family protein